MINQFSLQGRISNSPTIVKGVPLHMELTIACKRDYAINNQGTPVQNLQGYYNHETDFVKAFIFDEMLLQYAQSQIFKGQLVFATGQIQTVAGQINTIVITHYYPLERTGNVYRTIG